MKHPYIVLLFAFFAISCGKDNTPSPAVNVDPSEFEARIVQPDSILFTYLMDSVTLQAEVTVNGEVTSEHLTAFWWNNDDVVLVKDSLNTTGRYEITLSKLTTDIHNIKFGVANLTGQFKKDSIRLQNRPYVSWEHMAVGQKSHYEFYQNCVQPDLSNNLNLTLEVVEEIPGGYRISQTSGTHNSLYNVFQENGFIQIEAADLNSLYLMSSIILNLDSGTPTLTFNNPTRFELSETSTCPGTMCVEHCDFPAGLSTIDTLQLANGIHINPRVFHNVKVFTSLDLVINQYGELTIAHSVTADFGVLISGWVQVDPL